MDVHTQSIWSTSWIIGAIAFDGMKTGWKLDGGVVMVGKGVLN
jgi:hypothetical protein